MNMDKPKTISQKCSYALRAIFELALRDSSEPVKIQDIATAQSIPPRFLEVILAELNHAGFVSSKRGNDGGYSLALSADKLTVGEVIAYIQGQPKAAAGRNSIAGQRRGDYAFGRMWEMLDTAVAQVYDKTTFADLIAMEMVQESDCTPNYSI